MATVTLARLLTLMLIIALAGSALAYLDDLIGSRRGA